jgi:hypothetical protein
VGALTSQGQDPVKKSAAVAEAPARESQRRLRYGPSFTGACYDGHANGLRRDDERAAST